MQVRNNKIHKKSALLGAIGGILFASALLFAVPTFAKSGVEVITTTYRDIRIFVNGVEKTPTDVEPFIYNDYTYVPLRFISEALGNEVGWKAASNSIYIGTQPN
jgi:hypothetical protein